MSFIAPLFSVALSALFLGEQVGRHRWTAVAIGLGRRRWWSCSPAGAHLTRSGFGLALLAALGVAGVTITLRQIGRTERTPTIVLWFTCFSMLGTGLFMPFYGQAHDAATWAILLGLGLAGGIGQLFLTSSLRFAPVPVVVPFDYSQLLWAVLLGWLLWDTHPAATTWLGAAIIVGSGLYTLYREHKLGRDRRRSAPPSPYQETHPRADQPLRHRVRDLGGVAAGRRALRPDRLELAGNGLDPRADHVLVAVAQIFGRDVDDAAGVDHIIGRVEDAAARECGRRRRGWRAGCWRRRRRSAR